ncbi:hypothetical protein [Paenibacillus sp. SI8]|uniref:hypothetical protein n=1 Tax=unclassified Paenibacillus TaxID=185978 RepID=UPI003467B0C8
MKDKKNMRVSRRNFITGLGAAGIALLSGKSFLELHTASGQTVSGSTYGVTTPLATSLATSLTTSSLSGFAINVKDYKLETDKDDSASFVRAISAINQYGTIFIPAGLYQVSNKIIAGGKKYIKFVSEGAVITGGGQFSFESSVSDSTPLDELLSGDFMIKPSSSSTFVAGDYVVISGKVNHESYTPDPVRNNVNISFIAKITEVNSNGYLLDRKIQYHLTGVSASKVDTPLILDIESGIKFDSVSISVKYCVGGSVNTYLTGLQPNNPGVTYSQSCDFNLSATFVNLHSMHSLVLNSCNNMNIEVNSSHGSNTNTSGMTYVIRGNSLQNVNLKAICNSSWTGDISIAGSRHLNIDISSIGSCRYFRELSVLPSGQRIESCQFSECDDITIDANMTDVDAQAIEFLSVIRGIIRGKISTLPNSTEGAIVIKGKSKEINIINPIIRCWNPYAIKFEYRDMMEGIHTIIDPDIINFSADTSGIYVRDAVSEINTNLRIIGGYIKAFQPIVVTDGHNNLMIKNTLIESTGGYGIQLSGNNHTIDGVAIYGATNGRAITVNGSNTVVTNLRANSNIYIRYAVRANFNINNYRNNNVPFIYFDQGKWHIAANQSKYAAWTKPTEYTWEKGEIIYNMNVTELGLDGSKYVVTGWMCTDGGTPGKWVELRCYTGK